MQLAMPAWLNAAPIFLLTMNPPRMAEARKNDGEFNVFLTAAH
ncbi:hypothetical protein [Mesorhizobium sp. B2-3-4]|nr:hypothetical protein [Mesorhizobium sp. B2-3-4]